MQATMAHPPGSRELSSGTNYEPPYTEYPLLCLGWQWAAYQSA
jgi:hypothetical protein